MSYDSITSKTLLHYVDLILPDTILIVAAISHSCRHIPGVVGCGGAGVVVVVVISRLVVDSVLISICGVVEAFLCISSNRSIEKGVVDGDGQPVNSVEALI